MNDLLTKWGVWGKLQNDKECWLWYRPDYNKPEQALKEFGGTTVFCNEKDEAEILLKRWESDPEVKSCEVKKVILPEG